MKTLKNPQCGNENPQCCVAPSSHSLTRGWPRPPLQQTRRYATNLERMIYLNKQLKMAVIHEGKMVCYFDDGTSETHRSDEWNIDQMRLHVITQGAAFVCAVSAASGHIVEYYVNDKPKVQSISMSELFKPDVDNTGLAQPHNPWKEDKPQTESNGLHTTKSNKSYSSSWTKLFEKLYS